MGSARIWDERARAQRKNAAAAPAPDARADLLQVAPGELAALVSGIVQVTLDTRLADSTPGRRAELVRELETRLLALFGVPAHPPGAPVELPRPAAEVEDRQSAQPVLPEAAPVPARRLRPEEEQLVRLLDERFGRLGGARALPAELRARLVELILTSLPLPARASETGQATAEELGELEVMRRRAAKLEQALTEARSALAYVSGLERVETGLASIYRVVQGLSGEDPQRERKRGVLDSVFQANLALQKSASNPPAG